jgi:hypothetical protein
MTLKVGSGGLSSIDTMQSMHASEDPTSYSMQDKAEIPSDHEVWSGSGRIAIQKQGSSNNLAIKGRPEGLLLLSSVRGLLLVVG